jgi:hypothetical protein
MCFPTAHNVAFNYKRLKLWTKKWYKDTNMCTSYVIVSYNIKLKVKHDKINVWNITTE